MANKMHFVAVALLLMSAVLAKGSRDLQQARESQCPEAVEVVPVYRYWNGQDHFYTTDKDEIGVTVQGQKGKLGYVSEGIAFYAPPAVPTVTHPKLKQARDAKTFKIVHKGGLVLDVWEGKITALTAAKLYPSHSGPNQRWKWNGDTIESVHAPGMCLNVRYGLANGHILIIYPITRVANDQFTYEDGALTANGWCLTTKGQTSSGATVVAVPLDDNCRKEWTIKYH